MKKLLLTTGMFCFILPAFAQETQTAAPVKQNAYLAFRLGSSRMNMKMDDEKEKKSVFSLSGALGTKINTDLRAELEIMTYGDYEETEADGTDLFEYKHSAVNFSLNLLKDFDIGKAKPYLGGGVGFGIFYDELKYDYTIAAWRYWGKRSENNAVFSANVQAGMAIAVTDTVLLDVNARYTYFGDYKVFDRSVKMENKAVNLTAGLRLNF